jgi:hypothetical protein
MADPDGRLPAIEGVKPLLLSIQPPPGILVSGSDLISRPTAAYTTPPLVLCLDVDTRATRGDPEDRQGDDSGDQNVCYALSVVASSLY